MHRVTISLVCRTNCTFIKCVLSLSPLWRWNFTSKF